MAATPEECRLYYQRHREKELARARLYRRRYPEKTRRAQKNWFQRNSGYFANYRRAHRREIADYSKRRREEIKDVVFRHYGLKCKCCGVKEREFLTIDHVKQNGAVHRRLLKRGKKGGKEFYLWLIERGFPKGFRTLCMNCNWAEYHWGCPHKRKLRKIHGRTGNADNRNGGATE